MGERLTDRTAVLMALDAALQWEGELLNGTPDDDPQAQESRKLMAAYRRVQERISGSKMTITELAYEKALSGCRMVGIAELREMAIAQKETSE
jgi:hypothetical protein